MGHNTHGMSFVIAGISGKLSPDSKAVLTTYVQSPQVLAASHNTAAPHLILDFSFQNFGLHAPFTGSLGLQMEPSRENLWEILFLLKVEMKLAFLVCGELSIYTNEVAVRHVQSMQTAQAHFSVPNSPFLLGGPSPNSNRS
jgi:hypothetical protein